MRIQRNVSFDAELDHELKVWIDTKQHQGADLTKKDVFNGLVWSFLHQVSEEKRIEAIRRARDLSLEKVGRIARKSMDAVLNDRDILVAGTNKQGPDLSGSKKKPKTGRAI